MHVHACTVCMCIATHVQYTLLSTIGRLFDVPVGSATTDYYAVYAVLL
jgi:hypothetical protein